MRAAWPERLGTPPTTMLSGVPDSVDGRMLGISERAGASHVNADRMWHYTEGIENHSPVWPMHGIRILPGPSSMWVDATGRRLPPPLFPGFDTLGTLEHIRRTGHDHTWFVTTQRIVEKEFALSGSEQNPDLTGRDLKPGREPGAPWCDRPGRRVPAARRRLRACRRPAHAGARHERPGRRAAGRPRRARAAGRGARPRDREPVRQGRAGHRDPRRAALPRRPADPHRRPAPAARPRGRPAGRRPAARGDPQVARRPGDRPVGAGAAPGRRAAARAVRRRRGRRVRWRRRARLPVARGHLPRRLPVQRPGRRPRGRRRPLTPGAEMRAAVHLDSVG
nr:FAD-binding protein [Angustibacter aerolatus]